MPARKHTFCRICEPHCPLLADVADDGRLVALSPDLDHPSGSVACHKGLSYLEVHHDPDRLDWPLRRRNDRSDERGKFAVVEWSDAIGDIAARLTALREEHGNNSIAAYLGNPWSLNATSLVMGGQFQDLIGTDMRFSSNTQDSANRVTVNCEVYGSTGALMIPDIQHTDYLLILGGNPKVSRWLGMSFPNDNLDALRRIGERGGKVRFVNPRRIESSTDDTGPTLLIRPATDVYFLAAVLHEIDQLGGFDAKRIATHGKNVEEMRAFVASYPAERVAGVTGLTVEQIKEVARDIVAARSAVVYTATGVSQSRQGTLANWLGEMINFCTGNLGARGGSYKPKGLSEYFPPVGGTKTVPTSVGDLELPDPVGYAALPGALLADLIEGGDIKALIVYGGNPLLSIGGEDKMRRAFEKLELLITIDIYRSATAEMCDYVLPATDWLERMDINLIASGGQPTPYVQYADPVVEPAAGRRSGWWILSSIAQAMGLRSALDDDPHLVDGTPIIESLLAGQGLSIEHMRSAPSQTELLGDFERESVFERCLQHLDKKVDCLPPAFETAGLLTRCASIFDELTDEAPGTLKIISLRTRYIHNSWFANLNLFRRGIRSSSPLFMSERDARERGLHTGDDVRVASAFGSITTELFVSDEMGTGTVAMSHGSGHRRSFGLRVARQNPGANYNSLLPTGTHGYEPLSNMSWMTGVPVTVDRDRGTAHGKGAVDRTSGQL